MGAPAGFGHRVQISISKGNIKQYLYLASFQVEIFRVKKKIKLKDSDRAGLSIQILLTSIALSFAIPQIIFNMLKEHPCGQWIFIHITELGSVHHTWQSLVKKGQELEQQEGCRSLAHWQNFVGKSVQCLSMLSCCQSFIFLNTKIIPNVKYIYYV